MAILQVKNLPDELHAALVERSRGAGLTMSEYVTRLLTRDLAKPSLDQWRERHASPAERTRVIDVVGALDAVRVEYDPAGESEPAER